MCTRNTDTHKRTRSSPSAKRMAQQSPGHNASLHPLISAERIEERRRKGKNREVGGQGAKRKGVGGGKEREMPTEQTERCTEEENSRKHQKRRRVKDRRGGKTARTRAQQRDENEERMFASHLQWRRTAWQPSDACWMTISSLPLSSLRWLLLPFLLSLALLSFLGRKPFTFLRPTTSLKLAMCCVGPAQRFHSWQSGLFISFYFFFGKLPELVCQDKSASSRSINYYAQIDVQSETWIVCSRGALGVIYSRQLPHS